MCLTSLPHPSMTLLARALRVAILGGLNWTPFRQQTQQCVQDKEVSYERVTGWTLRSSVCQDKKAPCDRDTAPIHDYQRRAKFTATLPRRPRGQIRGKYDARAQHMVWNPVATLGELRKVTYHTEWQAWGYATILHLSVILVPQPQCGRHCGCTVGVEWDNSVSNKAGH